MIKAVFWDFGGVITSSPFESFNRYENDDDRILEGSGDVLGEAQWDWLDNVLKRGKESER